MYVRLQWQRQDVWLLLLGSLWLVVAACFAYGRSADRSEDRARRRQRRRPESHRDHHTATPAPSDSARRAAQSQLPSFDPVAVNQSPSSPDPPARGAASVGSPIADSSGAGGTTNHQD
jgi:hypothetical protein